MAMKDCRECKKEVSTEAKTCPHCGVKNPTQKQTSTGMKILIGFGIFVAGISFLADYGKDQKTTGTTAAVSTTPKPTQQQEQVTPVSVAQLFSDYEQNEARADSIYKDKLLSVRARVQSIDKDFMDNIVLMLASKNEFMPIHATIEKNQAQKAINLNKGDTVNLTCRGKGKVVGTPVLDDCTIQ